MTPEQWQRIKRIAGEACEQPSALRDAFVDERCAGDPWLHNEVRSLLHSAAAAECLYEAPALALAGAAEALANATAPARVASGDRIGPYRVVRELGHGGMGSVYLAERADGEFEQQVAIKFVNGSHSQQLLDRFRQERRILAGLHHPAIAQLLDGGTTADGRPYVIMEYVLGVPIEDYCESHRLPLRARLALFLQVCSAVQYAHQRLVVHRDIKSGNILVTPEGSPKLLDFGIATFVQPEPGLISRQTTLRALTPESASPEQVRGEPITIATDVYGLGVLLYRLVSGRSPYGEVIDSEAALVHAICDAAPAPPGADRDLDLIVLKALRKEPERRYSSVEQLSDDVARYLGGRPVLAAPDSVRYRAGKFLRRHRSLAAAAAIAAMAILGGTAAALYQASVAARERARAEQRLADVRSLASSFIFEFHEAIAELPGALEARRLVVRRAAEYLDRLARESGEDPGLQRELAAAYQRLGDIEGGGGVSNLGNLRAALEHYEAALGLRASIAARGMAVAADTEDTAQLYMLLSRAYGAAGELERAESSARRAVALLEPAAAREPRLRGPLASCLHQLGFVLALRGSNPASIETFARALDIADTELRAAPENVRAMARLGRIQADYGEQLVGAGRVAEALPALQNARATLEQLVEREPHNQRHRQTLVLVLNQHGAALAFSDPRAAADTYRLALSMANALRADAPGDIGNRFSELHSRYGLGTVLVRARHHEEGVRMLRHAADSARALLSIAPDNDYAHFQLASIQLELGEAILARRPDAAEGCGELREGLAGWDALNTRGHLPGRASAHRARFDALAAGCGARR